MCENVINESEVISDNDQKISVIWDSKKVCFDVYRGKSLVKSIIPRKLRMACRCAVCVDEMTNELKLTEKDVPEDVLPTHYEPKGNYALAVVWSDGHKSSIYPYERLLNWEIDGI